MIPFQLEAGGLQAALRDLAERAGEQSGIAIRFESSVTEVDDRTVARQLLRIAQESVNNAIKHAKPAHILIALDADDDGTYMQIQDDGDGMMPHAQRVEGLGIRIMRLSHKPGRRFVSHGFGTRTRHARLVHDSQEIGRWAGKARRPNSPP